MLEDTSETREDKTNEIVTKNISDENSNTIKCGISDEVVTMDVSWRHDKAK